jgi:hypothetical protein
MGSAEEASPSQEEFTDFAARILKVTKEEVDEAEERRPKTPRRRRQSTTDAAP